MRKSSDNTTIHSTLAYSRCRCHRVFKYRESKHNLTSRGSQASLTNKSKNSQNFEPEKNLLRVVTSNEAVPGDFLSSMDSKSVDSKCCVKEIEEKEEEVMAATNITDSKKIVTGQDCVDSASIGVKEKGKPPLVERKVLLTMLAKYSLVFLLIVLYWYY